MLRTVLLIGAAAVSFPALAQTAEPERDKPAPTQSEPATPTPAPAPDETTAPTDSAQPAPDSTTEPTDEKKDSTDKEEPAAEPESAPQ